MRQTEQLVIRSYLIGFLISTTVLAPTLPFMGIIATPFLLHFMMNHSLRHNVSVFLIYSGLELLIAIGSPLLLLTTAIEQMILLVYVVLLKVFQRLFKKYSIILYLYYCFHSHLVFLFFLFFFLSITGVSLSNLISLPIVYMIPFIAILYQCLLIVIIYPLNRTAQAIFSYINPINKTIGHPF